MWPWTAWAKIIRITISLHISMWHARTTHAPRNVLTKLPCGARNSPWFQSRQNSVMTCVLDAQSYIRGLRIAWTKILRIYDQLAHFDLACAHHARPRNVLKKVPSGARSSPWFTSRQNSVMTNVLDAQSYICGLTIAWAKYYGFTMIMHILTWHARTTHARAREVPWRRYPLTEAAGYSGFLP